VRNVKLARLRNPPLPSPSARPLCDLSVTIASSCADLTRPRSHLGVTPWISLPNTSWCASCVRISTPSRRQHLLSLCEDEFTPSEVVRWGRLRGFYLSDATQQRAWVTRPSYGCIIIPGIVAPLPHRPKWHRPRDLISIKCIVLTPPPSARVWSDHWNQVRSFSEE